MYAVRLKVVMHRRGRRRRRQRRRRRRVLRRLPTVAIALEGVLVTGDAEVVAPENVALAINIGLLRLPDARLRLPGPADRRRQGAPHRRRPRAIGALRRQLQELRTSGLDVLAVKAEVDRIAAEFAAVLDGEVVPIGARSEAAAGGSPAPESADAVSPSATPTATPDAGGGPTASPATASPTTTSSASASPSTPSPDAGDVRPGSTASPSPSPVGSTG